jgi:hypothetical protein
MMPSRREIQELAYRLRGQRRAVVQLGHGHLIVQPIVTTLVVQRGRPACVVVADDKQGIGGAVAQALELSRTLPEEIPFADITPRDAGVPVAADAFKLGAQVVDVDSYPDGVHVYPCEPYPDDPSLRVRVEEQRIVLPPDADAHDLGAAVIEALDVAVPLTDPRRHEAGLALEQGWVWPETPTGESGRARRGVGSNGSGPDADAAAAAGEAAARLAAVGYEPDYSAGSIQAIDELVAREIVAPGQPRSDGWLAEDLDRRVLQLGAYLGEVVRRELGGRWDGPFGPEARLVLAGGAVCWPIRRLEQLVSEGPVGGGVAGYAAALGVQDTARRRPKLRLPRFMRNPPVADDLEPVPPSLERAVLVATDGDALLVWPVHMYEIDLSFGRPVERLSQSVDDARLGDAIRAAVKSVRWAPARRDELSMAKPLYEPGSFARDAGLSTDEGTFIRTLTGAMASFTPGAARVEPPNPKGEGWSRQPGWRPSTRSRRRWQLSGARCATRSKARVSRARVGRAVRSLAGPAVMARMTR